MTKIIALVVAALLVGVDQLIKKWALAVLEARGSIEIIPNLFNLTYIENRGAAFGIFQGKTEFLSILVALVLIAALIFLFSDKLQSNFLIWAVALVIAGGAGNLIDRVALGFVVDYLDFSALFGFPVFNFADCCVVVGTALILIYVLFIDRYTGEKVPPPAISEETKEA